MYKKKSGGENPYYEIGKRVWELGNHIEKFAEDHYSSEMSVGWDKFNKKPKYLRYLQLTTPESPKYRRYLTDAKERPKVVGAFIWRVLTFELFECFHWLGARTGRNVLELREQLRPADTEGDYENKVILFNAWSAAAIEMLGGLCDDWQEQEVQLQREYEESRKRYIAVHILATIGHGSKPYKLVIDDLIQIVQQAWALDVFLTGYKEIQLFEWKWGAQPSLTGPRQVFDPNTDTDWDDRESRSSPLVKPNSSGSPQAETAVQGKSAQNTKNKSRSKPDPLSLETATRATTRHIRMVCSPALVKSAKDNGKRVEQGSKIIYLKRAVSLTPGDDPVDQRLDTALQLTGVGNTSPKRRRKQSHSAQSSATSMATGFGIPAHWGKVVNPPPPGTFSPSSPGGPGIRRSHTTHSALPTLFPQSQFPHHMSPLSSRPGSPFGPGPMPPVQIIRRASGTVISGTITSGTVTPKLPPGGHFSSQA